MSLTEEERRVMVELEIEPLKALIEKIKRMLK